jgi:hypothetical protein
VANTLAYYDTATITAVKSFIVEAPGAGGKKFDDTDNRTGGQIQPETAADKK